MSAPAMSVAEEALRLARAYRAYTSCVQLQLEGKMPFGGNGPLTRWCVIQEKIIARCPGYQEHLRIQLDELALLFNEHTNVTTTGPTSPPKPIDDPA